MNSNDEEIPDNFVSSRTSSLPQNLFKDEKLKGKLDVDFRKQKVELSKLRQSHPFSSHIFQDSDCSVHFHCIDKILKRHRIHLDRSKLEPLLMVLGLLSEEGKIKVRDFITVIDKNARFPDLKQQCYILPQEWQNCGNKNDYSDPGDKYRILRMPPAGVPTVRLDKPQPIFKDSIVNMDDLAEETNARALISPSIYTQYGVSHRDFFQPRSKEFLGNLFKKINVTLSDEDLNEIYKEGYEKDKTGGVCVETFRNILDERAYKAYNRLN